jgi:hypothetical protein
MSRMWAFSSISLGIDNYVVRKFVATRDPKLLFNSWNSNYRLKCITSIKGTAVWKET